MSTLAPWTIGVMGSGTAEHNDLAKPLGELLADFGVNLLTGGGAGVMTAVSRAYVHRPRSRGVCIGIIPCESEEQRARPKAGYPNEFIELAIHTHLPFSGAQGLHDLSRNHINILTSSAIVALPGEQGTASEIALAVRYRKPLLVFSPGPNPKMEIPHEAQRAETIADVWAFVSEVVGGGFPGGQSLRVSP